MGDSLKQRIIEYISDCYQRNKRVPSVRSILEHFKVERLNLTRFYTIFPGRLPEACRLAGIPAPTERIKRTAKATEAAKVKKKPNATLETAINHILLTEQQTSRLLGISHLEKGKNPSHIIDELLDRDSLLRKKYNLSLSDTKLVAEFLRTAVDRGWSTTSNPNIVDFITYLWNCGVQNLPAETVSGLISLLNDLKARRWNPSEFVKEATDIHNAVYWYRQFKAGYISAQQFREKVASVS